MEKNWQQKIEEYCEKYNIPLMYLAETLYEPKVVPMIRGKGFEYSVLIALQNALPKNEWQVSKASMSEDIAFHDTDIRVYHKRTGKTIRIECKLAKKEGYRLYPDEHSEIRVKCMRSRTLGAAQVKTQAPKIGVPEDVLQIHNDQYVASDFDVVITSIGNSFYRTDKKTSMYEWKPTGKEQEFLQKLGSTEKENLRDFAYNKMYLAKSHDLAARSDTGVICSRGKCKNKTNCGFIPNYPIIKFDTGTTQPVNGWVSIENCVNLFKSFIS